MLVTIHFIIKETLDVAICETHNGDKYNATNISIYPITTGIAIIGMNHVL